MTQGDPVEVNAVWAAGGPAKPPLRHWFGGYTFERAEEGKGTVLVKHVDGVFAGLLSRYPIADVRPEAP